MEFSYYAGKAFESAIKSVSEHRYVFITPEHFLLAALDQWGMSEALLMAGGNKERIVSLIGRYISDNVEVVPEQFEHKPEMSMQLSQMLQNAQSQAVGAESDYITIPHIISELLKLKESYAAQVLLDEIGEDVSQFISALVSTYEIDEETEFDSEEERIETSEPWRQHITCLNECVESHNPLIGREEELERTIQVLCRCDKNNPLHVGEPGVGKTAIVYGLAARIERGEVPERLKGFKIYELQMGTLVAGTQFRGEMEQRLKSIMDGLAAEGNSIVYIDEIHTVIGTGAIGDSALDTSSILKPYLERGNLRFIGTTTYEEYNRYIARNKGFMRRFQQIDIQEPDIDDAIAILEGLKERYERFHSVVYDDGVIEHTVRMAARYITGKCLPDKAIDVIDEAGAYRELHPIGDEKAQTVDKMLIDRIIAKICKVDALADSEAVDDIASLATLRERIRSQVYGQDAAIDIVVESIFATRAGLSDELKPQASLLFVGATGVGKTEIAKVLAMELGVPLQRFDMSEFSEKHSVAKLIGSPAGYVGYEDGGLLTDAIRKTPRCVLLLDEIEKAHDSIFDTLLQVMDYASLTDNRGNKVDFRHVVLIMTSNAGAQYAHLASVGFGSQVKPVDAMLKEVRRRFKPEFINRLSSTVVFNDMTREMAHLILAKRMSRLAEKLSSRQISLSLLPDAENWILAHGFSARYGARELDRVINTSLKPLLVHEILFGRLRDGGEVKVLVEDDNLKLEMQ